MGHTPIVGTMTMREALLSVLNEDMTELFSMVVALEMRGFSSFVIATEEEAIAGVDNTKAMTPLRTHQAIVESIAGYLQSVDHTKALHDALGIDADTLDGHHASEFAMPADHTKALHDALGIDADTLDGYDSTGFHKKDENIQLSEGQVVDFADEVGDKIRLNGAQYGIAVNTNELTLYAPSGSEIAVRDGAYNGQKIGDVIHTGNALNKGLAMKLCELVSTPGNRTIKAYSGNIDVSATSGYGTVLQLLVPWLGVTTYTFVASNIYQNVGSLHIKLNSTEYGPYYIPNGVETNISVNHSETGTIDIGLGKVSGVYSVRVSLIKVQTGNAEILYKAGISYIYNELKVYS